MTRHWHRSALCIATLAAGLMTAVQAGQTHVWVSVVVDGKSMMGFAAQDEPYTPNHGTRVGGDFTTIVRDRSGRLLKGYGFYGWNDGNVVRVVLLVEPSVQGADAGGRGKKPQPRYEIYARYTVPVGTTREMPEMKALGFPPASLRVERRPIR